MFLLFVGSSDPSSKYLNMIFKSMLLFSILVLFATEISAVKYDKCSMAKWLLQYGIPRSQLENCECFHLFFFQYSIKVFEIGLDVVLYYIENFFF